MSEVELYDPRLVPPPYGHLNTGVLCHLNSLVQAVISCSSVVAAVFDNRDYLSRTNTGRAFYDYVHAAVPAARPEGSAPFYKDIPVENCTVFLLNHLTLDLRRRRPDFTYGPNQESASEGLILLLDMMDDPDPREVPGSDGVDDAAPAYEENPISRLFYHRYVIKTLCMRCRATVSQETDVSVQFNLFHYDQIKNRPGTSAEFGEMLRAHVSALSDYRCEKCAAVTECYRHYVLEMVPEVIVCIFNIYDQRPVRYFPGRVEFPGAGGAPLRYRQVAQVEHSGSRRGGHYVARGLRGDGRVYLFDDRHYAPAAFGPAREVYMVFYHHDV